MCKKCIITNLSLALSRRREHFRSRCPLNGRKGKADYQNLIKISLMYHQPAFFFLFFSICSSISIFFLLLCTLNASHKNNVVDILTWAPKLFPNTGQKIKVIFLRHPRRNFFYEFQIYIFDVVAKYWHAVNAWIFDRHWLKF